MARKRSEKKEQVVEVLDEVAKVEKPKAPKAAKREPDKGETKCSGLSGSGCNFQRVQLPFCKNARGGDEIGRLKFCYEHREVIDQELKRVGVKS